MAAVGGRRIGVARTPGGVAVATALSSRFGVGDSINHYADQAQDTDHASFGVFRAGVLRAVDGWDENLLVNEDVDLDHRILAEGHRIRFDPDMHIYWHVRESVTALARQYRRYGRGKAAMVRKNGRGAVRLRHLAPPFLVTALAGAVLCAVLGLWLLALLLCAPYAVAIAVATVTTLRTAAPIASPATTAPARSGDARTGVGVRRRPGPFRLAAAFMAMHLGWGLGFLEGMVLRRPRPVPAPSCRRKCVPRGPAMRPPRGEERHAESAGQASQEPLIGARPVAAAGGSRAVAARTSRTGRCVLCSGRAPMLRTRSAR